MLNYANIKWFFRLFLALLAVLVIAEIIPVSVLISGVIGTVVFNFVQSFRIRSNYFHHAISEGNKEEKFISVTFDDGPGDNTNKVLNWLNTHQLKATFFIIGNKIKDNPQILKRMHHDGHLIGNHSFDHSATFAIRTPATILANIEKTNNQIKHVIGEKPAFFRPPFGVITPLLSRALHQTSMDLIGWSVRSFDTLKNKDLSLSKLKNQVSGGKIILLHDSSPDIIWLLEQLLIISQERHLKIVPLNELLNIEPYEKKI